MSDERRPLINQEGAQTGEQSYGNVAGRDITYSGIPIDALMRRLDAEITFRDGIVGALQQERKELHARLNRWEQDQDLYRELERNSRTARQAKLDADLEALREEQAAIREEQRRTRRVLFWFGIGIIVALLVAGWLTVDRFAALSLLRYVAGGALALVLGRAR